MKNQHSDRRLTGRYALDDSDYRRPKYGKRHIDFSLTAIRLIINPKKSVLLAT